MNYVLGFLFDTSRKRCVLLEKAKPEWQAGRYNGVGGKIEPGEGPSKAMSREFHEETGLLIPESEWEIYCLLNGCTEEGETRKIYVYRAFWQQDMDLKDLLNWTMTECPELIDYTDLPEKCLPNLRWLIPMALSMNDEEATWFKIEEKYS